MSSKTFRAARRRLYSSVACASGTEGGGISLVLMKHSIWDPTTLEGWASADGKNWLEMFGQVCPLEIQYLGCILHALPRVSLDYDPATIPEDCHWCAAFGAGLCPLINLRQIPLGCTWWPPRLFTISICIASAASGGKSSFAFFHVLPLFLLIIFPPFPHLFPAFSPSWRWC